MPKRSNSHKKRMHHPVDSIDQFQAYDQYSYSYQHQPTSRVLEDAAVNTDEPAQDFEEIEELDADQTVPLRASRIPFEKDMYRSQKHTLLGRLLFLLICVIVALVVLQGTVFRLKTVYVLGNKTKSPQEITMLSGLVKGTNIFSVDENDIRQRFAKDHTLELITMQKDYPSTIYLYISERFSVAAMQSLGMQYLLDDQGLVMEESNALLLPQDMPVVTGFQVTGIMVGQRLEVKDQRQISAYVSIMSELALQMYRDQISELNLSDSDNLYLVTVDGITVRLGNSDYMRAKIGAMRTDMAYLRQLGKTSGILDVSIPHDSKYMPDN